MIVFYVGYPGTGKSICSEIDESYGFRNFHIKRMIFQHAYQEYMTESEIQFIQRACAACQNEKNRGLLAYYEEQDRSTDQLFISVLLRAHKDTNITLDGFPRTVKQAALLKHACDSENILLKGYYIAGGTVELSIEKQIERAKKQGHEVNPERFKNKALTYEKETAPIIDEMQLDKLPITNCGVVAPYFHFSQIVSRETGRSHEANEYYFYPLAVRDYSRAIDKGVPTPIMATITLINKCDDCCQGCFNAYQQDGAMLTLETLDATLSALKEMGCKAIKVAGREPTCYPYLSEFVQLCEKYELMLAIITSGAHLDQYAELFKNHVDYIRVSINAADEETHTKYHRPSSAAIKYGRRLSLLKEIAEERRHNGLKTGVSYLIRGPEDRQKMPPFAESLASSGLDFFRYSEINYFRKADEEPLKLSGTRFFDIRNHKSMEASGGPCVATKWRVFIQANGDVVPCPNAQYKFTYGNINRESIKTIWSRQTQYSQDTCPFVNGFCKYFGLNRILGFMEENPKCMEDAFNGRLSV